MKKILLFVVLALLISACAKRNVKPALKTSPPNAQNCQCQGSAGSVGVELPPIQLPDGAKSTESKTVENKAAETTKVADFSLLKPRRVSDFGVLKCAIK